MNEHHKSTLKIREALSEKHIRLQRMMADLNKVRAETKKLQAETAKINKEATRYDWTVASSFSAFVTALLRLVF